MKTADLIGPALDWAVAKCENVETDDQHLGIWFPDVGVDPGRIPYTPSTDWAQGGPIAEREKIWVKYPFGTDGDIEAIHGRFGFPHIVNAFGPTELVARMRCYVASKLGAEIDVPEELLP